MRNNVLLFKKIKINDDLYIYNPVNVVSGYYEYTNNRSVLELIHKLYIKI
ncbi:MAG: hypothetical protein MR411_03070 [Tenericutes bacterium]|nr:hypothetical protein [Mycoplasmatota bacterium]